MESMLDSDHQRDKFATSRPIFASTHWSVVLNAGQSDSPDALLALERLAQAYWYPVYAYVRRKGYDGHSAEDLTQGFFVQLISSNSLGRADRSKGRFRSWLLGAMNHFLAHEGEKARAQKRGGGYAPVPLDEVEANSRYQAHLATNSAPEQLYDQQWALTLLERATTRLRATYAADGRKELYDRLKVFVAGGAPPSYSEVALQLRMSESAVKSAIHRLRQSFHELVRQEVAETVCTPADLDDEIRYLIAVLRS
jgi:RNA polymerase sigma factor (sigma-70 family)